MEFSAVPLAFLAGIIGIVSPCVWPLIPIMMSSAGKGLKPKLLLALGLALAFSLAGGVLSWALISSGLNPIAYRSISAYLLIIVGVILFSKALSDYLSTALSRLTALFNTSDSKLEQYMGPFGLGLLLGFVWLPCVGPTLGAAIALASQGQDLFKASIVMGSFGLGTAAALLLAASGLSAIFQKTSPAAFSSVLSNGKRVLGALLIGLGVLVVTGLDLKLEALVLPYLPEWSQF